jgi:hypothetical protein
LIVELSYLLPTTICLRVGEVGERDETQKNFLSHLKISRLRFFIIKSQVCVIKLFTTVINTKVWENSVLVNSNYTSAFLTFPVKAEANPSGASYWTELKANLLALSEKI